MTAPDPPSGPTPYRTARLGDLRIAPDRRPLIALVLFVSGIVVGGLVTHYGEEAWARHNVALHTGAVTPGLRGRTLPPSTLDGPGGAVTLPTGRPLVMNVWLQGCSDCMPAFEAARDVHARRGLRDIDVVNVAYGRADPAWAESYGVDAHLVFDEGGAKVVTPLGIGTFTTLVLDGKGVVRFVDRPDRAGYEERVRGAFVALSEP